MKRKSFTAILLTGALILPMLAVNVPAAEFSDGVTEQSGRDGGAVQITDNTEIMPDVDTGLFSSGEETGMEIEGELTDGYQVYIDNVTYIYRAQTDDFSVHSIFNVSGNTITLSNEIYGKKVTEIGKRIFDESFYEPPEPYIVVGNLILPDTLCKISEEAFAESDGSRMDIPDGVKEIGDRAFLNCEELRFLHFPAGMQVFPDNLFVNCKKLDEIEVADGVSEIQCGAMKGCPALRIVHIPPSVTAIGEDLFEETAPVTIYGEEGSYAQAYAEEYGIPFAVEGTGSSDTENIVLGGIHYTYQADTDSYFVTGYDGNMPSEVTIPQTVNGKEVTAIADSVFMKCSALVKISIPGSVRTIGSYVFSQCMNLEEVRMEAGVQTLGERSFDCCWNLKTAVLPDSITSIGEYSFYYCWNLKNLSLPSGLQRVEEGLFYEASMDGTLAIPEGVSSIGKNAFFNFRADGILLPDTLKSIEDAAFYYTQVSELVIPDSVTGIGQHLFQCCEAQSIILGRGIRGIRSYTFAACGVDEVALPDSVTEIGKNAFQNCNVYRINIPSSVKRIHKQAFAGCSRVTLFVEPGSYGEEFAKQNKISYESSSLVQSVVKIDGIEYQYRSKTDIYELVRADKELQGDVRIPSQINGKKVAAILEQAFSKCKGIGAVSIPDTVTSIGTQAFSGSSVKSVKLPAGLKKIENGVFEYTENLTSITIPDTVTSIGKQAFSHSGIQKADIPGSVKEMGEYAFSGSGVREVAFGDGVTVIPDHCFAFCHKLQKAEFSENLEEFGTEAFYWCANLEELTIPGSVKCVPAGVFGKCEGLKKVVLEDGVEVLGNTFAADIKEFWIPDSVYDIGGLRIAEDGVVYGNTGSKADKFCEKNNITFISLGTAVLEQPVIKGTVQQGNNIILAMKDRCDNSDFCDFALAEKADFPETGKAVYKKEKTDSMGWMLKNLNKGTYYLFARSARYLSGDEIEYSEWTKPLKLTVAVQAPKAPVIKSVKVKGNTVTVTVGKVTGAQGYGIVLTSDAIWNRSQQQWEPEELFQVTKNNKSTTYTFTNVEHSGCAVMARTYTRDAKGQNVYSKWSEAMWT